MIDDQTLQDVAVRMLADYDAQRPGTIYAEGFRLSVDDAWRLQTAVTELREARGEDVVGYKTGCQFEGNQKMMGLTHPVWGRLWNTEVHGDGASLKKADYANVSIEAEFGVTLSRDITSNMSQEDINESVEAIFPLLELHNLVLHGEHPRGHELIGNNCILSGIVRGTAITDLSAARQTDLKLIYDGEVIDAWDGLRWPEEITPRLGWLAGSLESHGLGLKAGQLILTGAWGPPIPVKDHTRVDVTSSAFGNVSATFL